MIRVSIDARGRVDAAGSFDVPMPAAAVWSRMRDIEWFLTRDPLHVGVRVSRGPGASRKGSRLVLRHRLLGIGPDRVGRILTWNEGRGYAISDLSRRGVRTGFPHICTYEVSPLGGRRCRITLGARGLWTAKCVPRFMARLWLVWVIKATEAHVMLGLWRLAKKE